MRWNYGNATKLFDFPIFLFFPLQLISVFYSLFLPLSSLLPSSLVFSSNLFSSLLFFPLLISCLLLSSLLPDRCLVWNILQCHNLLFSFLEWVTFYLLFWIILSNRAVVRVHHHRLLLDSVRAVHYFLPPEYLWPNRKKIFSWYFWIIFL